MAINRASKKGNKAPEKVTEDQVSGKKSPAKPQAQKKAGKKDKANPAASKSPVAKATSSASPGKPQAPSIFPVIERSISIALRFERYAWDVGGVLLLALALMTLLAITVPHISRGVILDWWAVRLLGWFGYGSVWVVSAASVFGVWMLRKRGSSLGRRIPWKRVFALEAAAFSSMALLAIFGGDSIERAEAGLDGGSIGWGLAELLKILLSPLGLGGELPRVFILGLIFLISILIGTGLTETIDEWARKEVEPQPDPAASPSIGPVITEAPLAGDNRSAGALELNPGRVAANAKKHSVALPPEFRKNFRLPENENDKAVIPPGERDPLLPRLDLLHNEQSSRPDEKHINLTAGLIEKTLSEFGIPARVVGFRVGPTVTQFAVEPGFLEKEKINGEGDANRQKVRVAQISSLHRDLALALSAERLRIEAPVPGRPYVGIEVPNSKVTIVRLRGILESEAFHQVQSPLAIALGRDVSGQPVVADLARMPHLLIAGTTGSGKSIGIASITTCLAMNNTPDRLRLVMVDPKMVELVRFNGLPHLLGKVETDVERILAVLRWTTAEMDRRYKLLEISHSRNIDTYNQKVSRRRGEQPLPKIVLMIDELADLMMNAPDQTEHHLVRLAQMARAVGIHLVVATQRPSTDVVTGLIKANFPARIAFAVASSVDSRVILDTQGAESLLGRGDMLFLQPEAPHPVRAQGAMVTDDEIDKVIGFWQKTLPPAEVEAGPSPWDQMIEEEAILADRDDLVQRAVDIVREAQKASASMLQRRLRIGYPRAARLMDELEELGVIGTSQTGGRDRVVLIGPDESIDGSGDADNEDE